MIRITEVARTLPFYPAVPLTNLPLIYHREHLFPYTSYGETAETPVLRAFRMVVLENDTLRVEVAPELGGRVYSLFDKILGQEILFRNPVVKPVRILPIWGFISGGIEFNFPIAHSPTSMSTIGCSTGQAGGYGYIRLGEREARTGMEWAVELGLVEDRPVLVQRTAFRNRTSQAHPWMSWTIAAVRSTTDTEFIHPPDRVLVHDQQVAELDWPGDGLNWDRNAQEMTAYFWRTSKAPQFGVFHHDLGFGLMHLADPKQLPGKKAWTYGHGQHRHWGQATTQGRASYAEIESGPLLDQSEKPLFPSDTERHFEEFWIPVHSRGDCDRITWPKLVLPPTSEGWPGWEHSEWQSEWEKFRVGEGPMPTSVVPTGLELEIGLRRELQRGNTNAAEPLALWLAFRGRPRDALPLVAASASSSARRIAGLILWKALRDGPRAVGHLEAGPLTDPVAVVELDHLYAELGRTGQRVALLAAAPQHRLVIERQADLALATGNPEKAIRLLNRTIWPREHQRYVRTELWRQAKSSLGEPNATVPDLLHEDTLASFGAYWSD